MINHVLLIPNRGIAWDDVSERELVICLNVRGKGETFLGCKFGETRYQLLQRRGWVNVDEVIGIHLQRVLYAVGVDYDPEHG